jgi:hypothetical protein
MKKLVVLILVVAAGYFAYQKFVVGNVSAEEKQVQALADEFSAAKQQMAQAERTAGVSGMDMTSDVAGVARVAQVLLEKLQGVKENLSEEKAIEKAAALESELRAFIERNT